MDEAMKNADSPNNLRLTLSLNSEQPGAKTTRSGLSLIDKEEQAEEDGNLQAEA
jgi:Tfp pilus assembly ATPase PilU